MSHFVMQKHEQLGDYDKTKITKQNNTHLHPLIKVKADFLHKNQPDTLIQFVHFCGRMKCM